jgi:O-antigen/teichoic acid export membrane protein
MNLDNKEVLNKVFSDLVKHAINYFPAHIIPALLAVVNVAIFTRIFTPNIYGQYILVITTTNIITAILSQWTQQSIFRFLPEFRINNRLKEFKKNLSSIVSLVVIIFLIISIIFYIFLYNILGIYKRFYFPGVVLIILGILFNNFVTFFQASLEPNKFVKYNITFSILNSIISISFIFLLAKDVLSLIWGTISSYFILLSWPFLKEIKYIKILTSFTFNVDLLKKVAGYGLPMVGWFLCNQILNLSDRYMIEFFRGSTEVGIYSANYNLVNRSIGLLSAPLLIAAHPLIINAWENYDKDRIQEIISLFSRYFLFFAIPVIVYITIFSKELVSILIGQEYRKGYIIIPFVLLGFLAWNFSMYGHKGFEIVKKTGIIMKLLIVSTLLNIFLNLIFIPLYGYIAAALTTLISFLLYCILIYYNSTKFIKWSIPWRSLFKITISAMISSVSLVVIKTNFYFNPFLYFIGGFIIYVVIYIIILIIIQEFREYELQLLKNILKFRH